MDLIDQGWANRKPGCTIWDMAGVKDLMKRRTSTPRRAKPPSFPANGLDGKELSTVTSVPVPNLPSASADTRARSQAAKADSGARIMELAQSEAEDTRKTLQDIDGTISGLASWQAERAAQMATLKRQLRQEVQLAPSNIQTRCRYPNPKPIQEAERQAQLDAKRQLGDMFDEDEGLQETILV